MHNNQSSPIHPSGYVNHTPRPDVHPPENGTTLGGAAEQRSCDDSLVTTS